MSGGGAFPSLLSREAEVLAAIAELRACGEKMSFGRIAERCGRRSTCTVYRDVEALVAKGLLERSAAASSLRLTALGEGYAPPAFSAWFRDGRGAA